jgi:hypothetical protein
MNHPTPNGADLVSAISGTATFYGTGFIEPGTYAWQINFDTIV